MKVIYALLIKVTQNSLQVILNSIQVIGWIQKFLIKIQNSVKITFIVCCTPWQILNAEPKCCLGKKIHNLKQKFNFKLSFIFYTMSFTMTFCFSCIKNKK